MCSERADADQSAVFLDVRQFGNVADVDQTFRSGQAQLHHRDQAVAARENLRAGAVFLKEAHRFTERVRNNVVEILRDHDALLAPAFRIFQIFSGRTGMSMWVTPNGESAST